MRLQTTPAAPARRTLAGLCAPFFCLLLVLSLPPHAAAQGPKTFKLKKSEPFKLRLKRSLNSGRIRIGDYVEFEVAEDVRGIPGGGGGDIETVIKAGTLVFGKVLDRRQRFTIFKKGAFSVGELKMTAPDGQTVALDIARPNLGGDVGKSLRKREEETRCPDKTLEKVDRANNAPLRCVRGRVYAGSFIDNLPSAVLAIATATILTRVKDEATDAVVAVTLADKLVSQPGLSNIINGVDAVMEQGEIFDATTIKQEVEIKLPGTKAPDDKQRVCRFGDVPPVPGGYIVTDYYSDLVGCRNLPGEQKVYTGRVIERYTDKPAGATMNLCEGPVPPGWTPIARKSDPAVCPREPGDPAREPHYSVILKTP